MYLCLFGHLMKFAIDCFDQDALSDQELMACAMASALGSNVVNICKRLHMFLHICSQLPSSRSSLSSQTMPVKARSTDSHLVACMISRSVMDYLGRLLHARP